MILAPENKKMFISRYSFVHAIVKKVNGHANFIYFALEVMID